MNSTKICWFVPKPTIEKENIHGSSQVVYMIILNSIIYWRLNIIRNKQQRQHGSMLLTNIYNCQKIAPTPYHSSSPQAYNNLEGLYRVNCPFWRTKLVCRSYKVSPSGNMESLLKRKGISHNDTNSVNSLVTWQKTSLDLNINFLATPNKCSLQPNQFFRAELLAGK